TALSRIYLVFFFQAEDGIRDFHVTGVQTCALPISAVCVSTITNRSARWPKLSEYWVYREVARSESPRHMWADEGGENGGADPVRPAGQGRGAGGQGFRA